MFGWGEQFTLPLAFHLAFARHSSPNHTTRSRLRLRHLLLVEIPASSPRAPTASSLAFQRSKLPAIKQVTGTLGRACRNEPEKLVWSFVAEATWPSTLTTFNNDTRGRHYDDCPHMKFSYDETHGTITLSLQMPRTKDDIEHKYNRSKGEATPQGVDIRKKQNDQIFEFSSKEKIKTCEEKHTTFMSDVPSKFLLRIFNISAIRVLGEKTSPQQTSQASSCLDLRIIS
ncbi:hypothetical protein LXL04_011548 [Taraxacum kok-saghyz]